MPVISYLFKKHQLNMDMKIHDLLEDAPILDVGNSKLLKAALDKSGFKRIGHGIHSDVYSRNDDSFVLKINTSPIDKAYLAYVHYVESNHNNPHLPRIGKISWHGNGADEFYYIPIEKLQPMESDEVANLIHTWLGYYTQDKELPPELENKLGPYKGVIDTIVDIDETLVGGGIILDLTKENFMRRGQTVVLTDPVADTRH
jgi:hypothetical protein